MRALTTQPMHLETTAMPGCGASVRLVGIVRPDRVGDRTVRSLEYHAYAQMAERQIAQWVDEARQRWQLEAVHVQHRVGVVAVGEVSVVVEVFAQHRQEAFVASQSLIEQIKHELPIWKQERYDDGTVEWVHCTSQESQTHAHV